MNNLSLNDTILNYRISYRLWNQYRKRKKTEHNLQLAHQQHTMAVAWGAKIIEHIDFINLVTTMGSDPQTKFFKILNAITPDES